MELFSNPNIHDKVKYEVAQICRDLGYEVKEEFKGKDWRADVLVKANNQIYAFEIQTSIQSLNKTIQRQEKYLRDGVIGCWLFEKEPNQTDELKDLPLFKFKNINDKITVSLKGRKELTLKVFLSDFLNNKIQFRKILSPHEVEVRIIDCDCWKCNLKNHIYYISNLISPCHAELFDGDIQMWDSEKLIFNPQIKDKVLNYAEKNKKLNMAKIKVRFSRTINESYMSFGCSSCDSIFGDWYIHEAVIETWYGDGVIDKLIIPIDKTLNLDLEIPHWCHPGEHDFCSLELGTIKE
ncbi:hypothetical protein JV173_00010 [Acholeplasma equirhinis]|uniref:competence protein CoiA family protein n=1 Tax=Acholeplasma equirhinis TaxID=555393 RepID=UPI00197A7649|nr:competence protein CoiA family protein [Acholeplasma equirhinis]MBN3489885.1 hypothetical protein [Acholeplasma equirhinis]